MPTPNYKIDARIVVANVFAYNVIKDYVLVGKAEEIPPYILTKVAGWLVRQDNKGRLNIWREFFSSPTASVWKIFKEHGYKPASMSNSFNRLLKFVSKEMVPNVKVGTRNEQTRLFD